MSVGGVWSVITVAYMDMISEKIHVRKCYIVLVFVLQFILVTVFTLGCKVLGFGLGPRRYDP